MSLHRQMSGAQVGEDFGSIPSDSPADPRGGKLCDGEYVFRLLNVQINDRLRNGGWLFVATKQVVQCLKEGCHLRPGDTVREKYGNAMGDLGPLNVKRFMGNMFGYNDHEQINDILGREDLDWSTPLTVRDNEIARDVLFRQSINTAPYTKRDGTTIDQLTQRSIHGLVQASELPEGVATDPNLFPNGTRESRGLPYYEDLNQLIARQAQQSAQQAQQTVTHVHQPQGGATQPAPAQAPATAATHQAAAPAAGAPAPATVPTPPRQ